MIKPPAIVAAEAARFLLAGGSCTLLSACVYLAAVTWLGFDPLLANVIGHCAGVLIGFRAHAHWTFAGRTAQPPGWRENIRFLVASGTALLCNALWVVLLVELLGMAKWTPLLPMILVTPPLTFIMNRSWVFAAAKRA